MSNERLLDEDLPQGRENISNINAFSVVIKYLDAYIEQDWVTLSDCLTEVELDRRFKRSDFFAHTHQIREDRERYVSEILPREYGEVELMNYKFCDEEEIVENQRIRYIFNLSFNERGEGEKYSEKVKFEVFNEKRRENEWSIDVEERVEKKSFLESVSKYLFSFFVRNEVCCVV